MPDGDGAVTIALPVTTDCTAEGAICTGYRRPLSNRLEVTVPGPPSQQPSQENSPATGAPAITGTAQLGETLTANTSGVIDADGLSNYNSQVAFAPDVDGDYYVGVGAFGYREGTYTLSVSED